MAEVNSTQTQQHRDRRNRKQRETERYTDRHRDRQRDRQRQTCYSNNSNMPSSRRHFYYLDPVTDRRTDLEIHRQTDRQTDREPDRDRPATATTPTCRRLVDISMTWTQ